MTHGMDWDWLADLAAMGRANPFGPDRKRLERRLLRLPEAPELWSLVGDPRAPSPNLAAIDAQTDAALERLPRRVAGLDAAQRRDLEEAILVRTFHRYAPALLELVTRDDGESPLTVPWFDALAADLGRWRQRLAEPELLALPATHLVAVAFQLRRAFVHVFESIVGASRPAAELRASVWSSIFGRDFRRYVTSTWSSLRDFSVLITGPSGSGKELVARAIGNSQYRTFEPNLRVLAPRPFRALSPAALAPTLVESELFGHARGSFTGATKDREGWLETDGTVFLDEIGELEPTLQVKLLRVLQTRRFERIGETQERRFEGKLIAATHRELGEEITAGRFRADLYYRLCADRVETPSLAEQLRDRPEELPTLVRFITGRLVPAEQGPVADALAAEVSAWIVTHLGIEYAWPGNFRELEQCVRNVVLKGRYVPLVRAPAPVVRPRHGRAAEILAQAIAERCAEGVRPVEELLTIYTSWAVAETGSFVQAARALDADRRTVRARIDEARVLRFREAGVGLVRARGD